MNLKLARVVLAILGLAAVSLLVGSCQDEIAERESQSDERLEEYLRRQAEVVARAFNEGRLGPKDEVLAEMERVAQEETVVDEETFEETVPRFFTPDGQLIPWDQMDEDQRGAQVIWVTGSERVQAAVRGELNEIANELKVGSSTETRGLGLPLGHAQE